MWKVGQAREVGVQTHYGEVKGRIPWATATGVILRQGCSSLDQKRCAGGTNER